MRFAACLTACLLLLAGPAPAQSPRAATEVQGGGTGPFVFVAFGDMPYCLPQAPEACPGEFGRVARLVRDINAANPAFSVFIGDTKGGSEICSDERLLQPFSWMTLATAPLVYTPGDNEWTDCWQDRTGRYDPLERLAFLRARFFRDDRSLGRAQMRLTRQADVDPANRLYVENARWTRSGVVFATVHFMGSNNNRPTEPGETPASNPPAGAMEEFQARDAANIAWMAAAFAEARATNAPAVVLAFQAEINYVERCGRGQDSGLRSFREALIREAAAFGRPVLIIHGDSHFWLHDRPFPQAQNVTRIMVPGDRETRAVRVAVDPAAADPWSFSLIGLDDRLMTARCD
jgi:hypothetical protein